MWRRSVLSFHQLSNVRSLMTFATTHEKMNALLRLSRSRRMVPNADHLSGRPRAVVLVPSFSSPQHVVF